MNELNSSKIVAQAATTWRKETEHQDIMNELKGVYGEVGCVTVINGNEYYWKINQLSDDRVKYIVKRGNHEEILFMIHQYGHTPCPKEKWSWLKAWNNEGAWFSDEALLLILEREDAEELDALATYHAFSRCGQLFVLDSNDHSKIMRYIAKRPFLFELQPRLIERNNPEEIALHGRNHGWSTNIVNDMLDRIKQNGTDEYYRFINQHEFPIPGQNHMLEVVDTPEFMAYITLYGLWEGSHGSLVYNRTEDEIIEYLKKHPHLDTNGERALAHSHLAKAKMFYAQNRYHKKSFSFLDYLFQVDPLDYATIAEMLIQQEMAYSGYVNQDDIKLMKEGSHKEVMERIMLNPVDTKSLLQLFFRNNPEEFEAYVKKWFRRR